MVNRPGYVDTAVRRKDIPTRKRVYGYDDGRPGYGIFCRGNFSCGGGYMVGHKRTSGSDAEPVG